MYHERASAPTMHAFKNMDEMHAVHVSFARQLLRVNAANTLVCESFTRNFTSSLHTSLRCKLHSTSRFSALKRNPIRMVFQLIGALHSTHPWHIPAYKILLFSN